MPEPDPFAAWHTLNSPAPEPAAAPAPAPALSPFPPPVVPREDLDVSVEEELFKYPAARTGSERPPRAKARLVPLLIGGLVLTAIVGAAVVLVPPLLEQKPKVRVLRADQSSRPAGSPVPTSDESAAQGSTAPPPPALAAPAPVPLAAPAPAPLAAPAPTPAETPHEATARATSVKGPPPSPAPPAPAPEETARLETPPSKTGPPAKAQQPRARGRARKSEAGAEDATTEAPPPAQKRAQARSDSELLDLMKKKEDAPAPAPPPSPRLEEVTGLTPQQVKATLASRRRTFDACIDEAIAKDPGFSFAGRKVGLFLTVNPSGVVSSPFLDDPDVDDSPLGVCLKAAGNKVVFPAFQGEAFQVRVPLAIRKAG